MTIIASDKQEMIEVLEGALALVKSGRATGVAVVVGNAQLRCNISYSGELPALIIGSDVMKRSMEDIMFPEPPSSLRRPVS
jgi:hypothetical protein